MLTFLIGSLSFLLFALLGFMLLHGPWWTGLFGMIGFLGTMVPLNLWVKKRLERVFQRVQTALQEGQDSLRRKAGQMQRGFTGSPKAVQKLLEKEQVANAREALTILDEVIPLYRWNLLAERQANTIRAQLHYQLKEFEEADRCLARSFILDAFTLAMKLARQYTRGEDKAGLDKAFTKALRKYKGDKGVILVALYSWILVRENRVQEALTLLAKAKDDGQSEVLRSNWEHLANNRVKSFSNAGLGDSWYALHLEEPKPVKVRQQRQGGPWFR